MLHIVMPMLVLLHITALYGDITAYAAARDRLT